MTTLPYLSSPGNLVKALSAMRDAALPAKLTQDFVKTILGITGGSGDNMTSFLRRVGFANADSTPSEIYKKFRNPTTSKAACAEAIRHGYAEVFRRNEYAYRLPDSFLKGLIVEITGGAPDAQASKLTYSTLKNFLSNADFETANVPPADTPLSAVPQPRQEKDYQSTEERTPPPSRVGLNLGYTININLPASTDVNVFNAIFKALKDNLLTGDD